MICQKILCFMLQTLTPLYYFSQKNLNKLKIDSENMCRTFTYFFFYARNVFYKRHCLGDFFFLPESNSFTSVPYTWEVEFYCFYLVSSSSSSTFPPLVSNISTLVSNISTLVSNFSYTSFSYSQVQRSQT